MAQRRKINIWTFLFKELTKSIEQILYMCEIENKLEFCKGVRETFKKSTRELDKIEQKIKLESGQNARNCAWEVPLPGKHKKEEDILKESGYEARFEQEFDEDEIIEFNLLDELVHEGKMNLYDAIVLIIREKATFYHERNNSQVMLGNSHIKTIKPESTNKMRACSQPLPFSSLISRINLKLRNVEREDVVKEKERKLHEKIEKANNQKVKSHMKKTRAKEEFYKRQEKVRTTQHEQKVFNRHKNEDKLKKKIEVVKKKNHNIEEIRRKAKQNNMKASEVNFILMLEKQKKKLNTDTKIEQARRVKRKLIEDRQNGIKSRNAGRVVRNRKEELENIKIQKYLEKQQKMDDAEKKRLELLEVKKQMGQRKKNINSPIKANKPTNFIIADLLASKDHLDLLMENVDYSKLKGHADQEYFSKSFDLEVGDDNHNTMLNTSFEADLEQEPVKGKKKRKRKKMSKKAKLLEDGKANELKNYYRFLTKDMESMQTREKKVKTSDKKPRKSMPNIELPEDLHISEYSELICREYGKKEKSHNKINEYSVCTLCNEVIDVNILNRHLESKIHKKLQAKANKLGKMGDVIVYENKPDFISNNFVNLKKKCKKIKAQVNQITLKYQDLFPKDASTSSNKKRMYRLCMEFEKQVMQQKKDYEAMGEVLTEIHRVIDKHEESDYVILRQVRFIDIMTEFFKSSHSCCKFEKAKFIEVLNSHFKILNKLAVLKENRKYMLLTNRVIPIIDLLSWSWCHQSGLIVFLEYIPKLLGLLTILLKQKLEKEYDDLRRLYIDYIFFCGFFDRVHKKFNTHNPYIEDSALSFKTSLRTIRTLNFIEVMTEFFQRSDIYVMDSSIKINEKVHFIMKETEIAGCLHFLATILLSQGQFGRSVDSLPKLCLSQAFFVLRIMNNIARSNIVLIQTFFTSNSFHADQFYHCTLFLFEYCIDHFMRSKEVLDILQELILLIGYFSLLCPNNQTLLSRGTETHTILYKLFKLPNDYYYKKTLFKELLFPTLLCVICDNKRNAKLFINECGKDLLLKYIKQKRGLFSQDIPTEELHKQYKDFIQQNIAKHRSIINLNTVNPEFYILSYRFPVELLESVEDLIESIK